MTIAELQKALPYLFEAGVVPHIMGHFGVGKSALVKAYAEANGLDFIDLRLGQMADSGDILGLASFVKDGEGKERTKFALPTFFPTKGKDILFLDELSRATKDILQAVFQLVLDKRIGEYKLPAGWVVVAASNPNTDEYSVTSFEDAAFLDRFCHIKLTPTVKEWIKWAKAENVHSDIVGFIEEHPKMLEVEGTDFALPSKPSRRSYHALSRILKQEPPVAVARGIAYGLIGVEAGTALIKFQKDGKDIVLTPQEILQSFGTEEVQEKLKRVMERHDVMNKVGNDFVESFEKRTTTYTKAEEANVIAFIKTLPKDFALGVVERLHETESYFCTESDAEFGFGNNEELAKYIEAI